jgi:regulator of sigma E protease
MIVSLIYVVFAILGLSVLIFAHELGHYFMARRVGMRVEVFSIGFGQPIVSWDHKGVKWQIGWIPFGGYVKIFGQESDETRDPYSIPDSFFGKKPLDRIKVAFAGPFVNLLLAFVLFAALWAFGGREKNFSEFTHKIGWIDTASELYALGLRPGDEISTYDDHQFQGAKDHLYASMLGSGEVDVKGKRVDYLTGAKEPFEFKVKTYPHPYSLEKGVSTTGILNSANYIIYDHLPSGKENPLPEGSPMAQSGIAYGDRIVWVDGELIFSGQQLSRVLNDGRVLLTVMRNGKSVLARVPRVSVQELRLDGEFKEELTDWQYEAGLNTVKIQKLYVIPYNLNNEAVVEGVLKFIDKDNAQEAFPTHVSSLLEQALQVNDKIIAIDGKPINKAYDLLAHLQQDRVNVIVERNRSWDTHSSWLNADAEFDKEMNARDLQKITSTIGTKRPVTVAGNYVLLNTVTPKMRNEFQLSAEKQAWLSAELLEKRKELEGIEDPEKRSQALVILDNQEKQLLLGLPSVQDRRVEYNPSPIAQFNGVLSEIGRTLKALITGSLSPKWMSGPIGIFKVVHDNSMISL